MRIGRSIRTNWVNTLRGKVEVRLGVNGAPIFGVGNGIKGWKMGELGWNLGVRMGKVGLGSLAIEGK